MSERINPQHFHEADGVEDWRVLEGGATTFFRTGSFVAGAGLVQEIGRLAGLGPRQPDADLRHDGVTVRLITSGHDYHGIRARPRPGAVDLGVARDLGLSADPSAVQSIGPLVIDALDIPAVMPFWRALFDYVPRADSPDEDLVDPRLYSTGFSRWMRCGRSATGTDTAVWVPHELAEARVAAARPPPAERSSSTGARRMVDAADPEGNEADVATTVGRE